MTEVFQDHEDPAGPAAFAAPLAPVPPVPCLSPAEAARTLAEHGGLGALCTLTVEPPGHPFGSVAPYGLLDDGSPVLCISRLAEHTRNLEGDPRASLLVTDAHPMGEPMDNGRLTLMGSAVRPVGDTAEAARAAFLARNPEATTYESFGDFSYWVLRIGAVRWVGGFGRMAWCATRDYAEAEPDPTAPVAAAAVQHLNEDHADAMLTVARALTGHPDANAASVRRVDRYGIDLAITTPRGPGSGRAAFDTRIEAADELRMATVRLVQRARGS